MNHLWITQRIVNFCDPLRANEAWMGMAPSVAQAIVYSKLSLGDEGLSAQTVVTLTEYPRCEPSPCVKALLSQEYEETVMSPPPPCQEGTERHATFTTRTSDPQEVEDFLFKIRTRTRYPQNCTVPKAPAEHYMESIRYGLVCAPQNLMNVRSLVCPTFPDPSSKWALIRKPPEENLFRWIFIAIRLQDQRSDRWWPRGVFATSYAPIDVKALTAPPEDGLRTYLEGLDTTVDYLLKDPRNITLKTTW